MVAQNFYKNNNSRQHSEGAHRLQARGSLNAALRSGVRCDDSRRRFHYVATDPITGVQAQRSKAYEKRAEYEQRTERKNYHKCLWHAPDGESAGKPEGLNYYAPQGGETLRAAIAAAEGVLLIVNGEPAVWVALEAGRENVLSWFGEGSVPKTLISDLQALGARSIRFMADTDSAGHKTAAKVRDILSASNIEFAAVQLPFDFTPSKGQDINDLWIQLDFDRARFWAALDACPLLDLPTTPAPDTMREQFRRTVPEGESLTWDAFYRELDTAMERTFAIKRYNKKGWSNNYVNHWRGEDDASAGYNRTTHTMKDFNGDVYPPRALAQLLGIPYPADQYTPPQAKPKKTVTTVTATEAATSDYWSELPSEVGEILKNTLPENVSALRTEKTLRLLIKAINNQLIKVEGFTVEDISAAAEHLGVQLSRSTIARGLEDLAYQNHFLSKVAGIESIPPNFDKNSKTGRPATIYQMLPKHVITSNLLQLARRYLAEKHLKGDTLARFTPEMLAALAGEEAATSLANDLAEVIDPVLQRQSWQREQAFKRFSADLERLATGLESPRILKLEPRWVDRDPRAATARAILRSASTNVISYKQWARELGCAESYVPTILDRAGIQGTPNFEEIPIKTTDLQREVRRISYQKRCKVFELRVKEGERYIESRPLSLVDTQWMKNQQAQGRQIVAQVRLANAYEIVRDEPEPKPERTPIERFSSSSAPTAPKQPRLTLKHDYRDGYNPRWVFGQLVLAAELVTGYQAYHTNGETLFIDQSTGEIVTRVQNYRDLLPMLWASRDDLAAQTRLERNLNGFLEVMG